ncbi:hypothetical protein Bca101_011631 [Brassica carinata]
MKYATSLCFINIVRYHPLINSPCDDVGNLPTSYFQNCGNSGADLSKDVPPHKHLRDGKSNFHFSSFSFCPSGFSVIPMQGNLIAVNQILSILQRPNGTATCSDINPKMPMPLTKIPPESNTSKHIKVEPISPRAVHGVRNLIGQDNCTHNDSSELGISEF